MCISFYNGSEIKLFFTAFEVVSIHVLLGESCFTFDSVKKGRFSLGQGRCDQRFRLCLFDQKLQLYLQIKPANCVLNGRVIYA